MNAPTADAAGLCVNNIQISGISVTQRLKKKPPTCPVNTNKQKEHYLNSVLLESGSFYPVDAENVFDILR